MCPVDQLNSTYQEDVQFLSHPYASIEAFSQEYRKIYHGKSRAKELYRTILAELEKSSSGGNAAEFKRLGTIVGYINDIESRATLNTFYTDTDNRVCTKNFIILACKHNRLEILKYLFGSAEVFKNLIIDVGKGAVLPEDRDETSHDAFYYAIRSCNVELLDVLISKWPGNYFETRSEKLDEILSKAYEELKLKNVSLSSEMEVFVEGKLIDLRFYSNRSGQLQSASDSLRRIGERINLVLKNIALLKSEYSCDEKIDAKFLFVGRFIAQNIHILKRKLKLTYDRLPWEEVEFCLVAFISSCVKSQEINLFYRAILTKSKILLYLEEFAKKLSAEKPFIESLNVGKLAELPKLNHREMIVPAIIRNNPQFLDLYSDHQQIRDIHSLERVSNYLNLALSVNPKEREGQLIIIRALQVIGEYFKNTLEAPKLSSTTSELLLLSLPQNTRKVIIDLRNSLSHAYSLSKRTEIEENANVDFFIGVQNDTKRIDNVITDILYNKKIKMVETLLKKIVNSDSLDEVESVDDVMRSVEIEKVFTHGFNMMELEKIEKLIRQLSAAIIDKNDYEKKLFDKINSKINSEKTKSRSVQNDYSLVLTLLKSMSHKFGFSKSDHNVLRGKKFSANKVLEHFIPQVESHNLKEIVELSMSICSSAESRVHQDVNKLHTIERLSYEIFYIAEFGVNDIKWIEKLRKKLLEKSCIILPKKGKTCNTPRVDKYEKQLTNKLSELKNILQRDSSCKSIGYSRNKKSLGLVEMLVLDIMSILGRSEKHLEDNQLFLDDSTPVLIGKSLRNHLAHGNTLLDVLLFDPSLAVLLNAEKLVSENIVKGKKKVGKSIPDDPTKLSLKQDLNLASVINQENMFAALVNGNLEDLKSCLEKGADMNAKTISLKTALHCAAQCPDIDAVKFVIQTSALSVKDEDINGQSPLHFAAAYGRHATVDFFLTKYASSVSVDDPDKFGKTPLHLAAINGHEDTIEVLLKHGAVTDIKDQGGNSPLHYAASNNHVGAVKVLTKKERNVDINETKGGFTPLHVSAEFGCVEVVQFLLKNGANVNARNDNNRIPLHSAALNGHLAVVNALILNGTDVNAKVIDGCTPLHYATENGHEEVAAVLLKHGAKVNAADKTYGNTPLHYVAKDGYERIVELFLKNKANANIATKDGSTPLHIAAHSGHANIVASLLKHGVNIHAKDIRGYTALHCAAISGHEEVAQLLIRRGAKVDAKGYDYSTPLFLAALEGHERVVDLLVKNKADVCVTNTIGVTPLFAAAESGHKAVIDVLLKNKVEVSSRCHYGQTLLHVLARGDNYDIIVPFFLKYKPDVNVKDDFGFMPLHAAILCENKEIVKFFVENGAEVNNRSVLGCTPLNLAIETGHKEIVQVLVSNGADVNRKSNDVLPLVSAIRNNNKDIVEILIANGAKVNAENGVALSAAVFSGRKDIFDILLKNNARVHVKGPEDATLLHLAAKRGIVEMVDVLISKGVDVNAITSTGASSLMLAAQEGHSEVIDILLENGAKVDFNSSLHLAAGQGHVKVVDVLLRKGAKINAKDNKNRTAIELAVAHGHLPVVEMLMRDNKIDLNAICNNGWTLLHIAAQENNLEMIKYLVEKGIDIHAKNPSKSKPIHIAAREGFIDAVEFFLAKGMNVEEPGSGNQTSLHYAAAFDRLEVIKLLIDKSANVNAKDNNGSTPLHIASVYGFRNVVVHLLQNGAIYNAVNEFSMIPLEMAGTEEPLYPTSDFHESYDLVTNRRSVVYLLLSVEKLFDAVKRKCCSDVEKCIKAGALVNVKNTESETTPLHYAAWKGCEEIVNILLQNKADPNAVCSKGFTALHYAVKYSHLECVRILLQHGAIYNIVSRSGKTPLDFATNKSITDLFNVVDDSFVKVRNSNIRVIADLNKVNKRDLKAIMNARNRENQCLIAAASQNNVELAAKLKYVSQGEAFMQFYEADQHYNQGNFKRSLGIYKHLFEKRKQLLGPNNPSTLDMQTYIAKALYKLGNYQEALDTLDEIFLKQNKIFGIDGKDTLETRSLIALVMHRKGEHDEAFDIYQEVYQKQKKLLGPNHEDTVATHFHMALVLHSLGRYEEALSINRAVFEIRKKKLGSRNINTVATQNNIAMVLGSMGKHEEALKMYEEVYERKKEILGLNHLDTLRTMQNIAGVLFAQRKFGEALRAYKTVLDLQKKSLPQHHPETLNTQYNIGNVFFNQGKYINAFKVFKECEEQRKAVFGPINPTVLDAQIKMDAIAKMRFKLQDTSPQEILQHLQKEINIASSEGDVQSVSRLLADGADVNDQDTEGRTPLHFAVNNGHLEMVNLLLKNKADVTLVTNKGNTPLHTAVSKNCKEIVQVLLQHLNRDRLRDFVNAKTATSGTTSLHVAAKNGYLEIVKLLLKNGAIYDILNKEGKTPIDLASDRKIIELFTLIEELFECVKKGKVESIDKLKSIKPDDFVVVTNARNSQEYGLLQVAIKNKRKNVANELLALLKKPN